jgi:hypothetical protein
MIRLTVLSAYYWVVAQDGGAGTGSPFDLGVFGIAGTTIAILLFIARTLWNDNKELRVENNTIQQFAVERVATIATQSSTQLQESAKILEATTVMMHQLSGRPALSSEQLAEINYNLRVLREFRERPPDARDRRTDGG